MHNLAGGTLCTVNAQRAEPSTQSMHGLAGGNLCTVNARLAEPSAQSMHDKRNPLHSQCTTSGTLCTVNARSCGRNPLHSQCTTSGSQAQADPSFLKFFAQAGGRILFAQAMLGPCFLILLFTTIHKSFRELSKLKKTLKASRDGPEQGGSIR